ncbi:MAG: penicillin-binding protein, partial [Candidatus Acidiferrum sp.]
VEIWSRFMRAAHNGVPPQPLPGGIWHGFGPGSVPVAENNGWPSLPDLFGAPQASQARQVATPPALPPENLPVRHNDARTPHGPGAPVPPADIPNARASGEKHRTQSGKQNSFDALFGG